MELRRRLLRALAILGLLVVVATVGFHSLADGVSWLDALYMVVISLAGVGYSEIVSTAGNPALRAFNIVVLLTGFSLIVYVLSLATAFFVEGNLGALFRRRRMERKIEGFNRHYVVCGAGEVGGLVAAELARSGSSAVVIAIRKDRLQAIEDRPEVATLEGDATDLATLERAGLARASCVVAALPHEKDNLVVTVLVRQSYPSMRVVARHVDAGMADRLRRAGASAAVSPTAIGGLRLASEAVRPHVVGFLDLMLKERSATLRIEEIRIGETSPWAGRALGGLGLLERWGLTALALRDGEEGSFRYGLAPQETLARGSILIVLGDVARIIEARTAASS